MKRIMTSVAFWGGCRNLNVDAAVKELEQAGYRVHRLLDEYAARLQESIERGDNEPGDDFIEAERCFEPANAPKPTEPRHTILDDDENAVWNEIEAIVDRYGGVIVESGKVDPEFTHFASFLGSA